MEDQIEITGVNLVELVKRAYDLSNPQGLGFIHYKDGGLSDEQANSLIDENDRYPVSLDYVCGRACKLDVFKSDDERLYIRNKWYDHSAQQLKDLLLSVGLSEKCDQVSP